MIKQVIVNILMISISLASYHYFYSSGNDKYYTFDGELFDSSVKNYLKQSTVVNEARYEKGLDEFYRAGLQELSVLSNGNVVFSVGAALGVETIDLTQEVLSKINIPLSYKSHDVEATEFSLELTKLKVDIDEIKENLKLKDTLP